MHKHTTELEDRFSDAAIAYMMDQYAQEEGDFLLQQYLQNPEPVPQLLDLQCQRFIQKSNKHMLIASTLKRAGRIVAILFLAMMLVFPLAMSVEAFRIPVINYILKHGKGVTEITFYQDSDSFTALEQLRTLIYSAMPDGFQLEVEHASTSNFRGVEDVSSLLMRFQNGQEQAIDICITKAEGSMSIDSQETDFISLDLYGQQAIFISGKDELRVLWINEEQQQLYSVSGYGTAPDTFWECIHTLSQETQNAQTKICF